MAERPIIRSIEYIGNHSFTEAEILDAYINAKIGLAVDAQFDYRKVRDTESVLPELMARHGKLQGRVHVETESILPNGIRLRFVINEEP